MIGIDLVETARIKAAEKRTPGFLKKVFTEAELAYCLKHKDPYPRLAARFAAKEAVVKALGSGFRGIDFQDIEVISNALGKPKIQLSNKASSKSLQENLDPRFKDIASIQIELSLTHTENYGAAVALISSNTKL